MGGGACMAPPPHSRTHVCGRQLPLRRSRHARRHALAKTNARAGRTGPLPITASPRGARCTKDFEVDEDMRNKANHGGAGRALALLSAVVLLLGVNGGSLAAGADDDPTPVVTTTADPEPTTISTDGPADTDPSAPPTSDDPDDAVGEKPADNAPSTRRTTRTLSTQTSRDPTRRTKPKTAPTRPPQTPMPRPQRTTRTPARRTRTTTPPPPARAGHNPFRWWRGGV